MLIKTFEDALASIGCKVSDLTFVGEDLDLSPKATNFLRNPVPSSRVEGAILARTEHFLFE